MVKTLEYQGPWFFFHKVIIIYGTLFVFLFTLNHMISVNIALLLLFVAGGIHLVLLSIFLHYRRDVLLHIEDEELKEEAHDIMLRIINQRSKV